MAQGIQALNGFVAGGRGRRRRSVPAQTGTGGSQFDD